MGKSPYGYAFPCDCGSPTMAPDPESPTTALRKDLQEVLFPQVGKQSLQDAGKPASFGEEEAANLSVFPSLKERVKLLQWGSQICSEDRNSGPEPEL